MSSIDGQRNVKAQWNLFGQLLRRDVMIRYKGSALGFLWSVINPLILLTVYTFVFGVIFKSKWGIGNQTSTTEYALVIFTALVFFNVFSETVTRSPGLILANVSYVTKVVFPLEVLSGVALGNALIHSAISLVVLLTGTLIFYGSLHWTVLLVPLIYIPLVFLCLGLSWMLSSLGVFLRDINYFVAILVQILFFMTPIFYPVSSVPVRYQGFMALNPMTGIIDNARRIIIFGQTPSWDWWFSATSVSVIVMVLGYIWFAKTKRAFVDVI